MAYMKEKIKNFFGFMGRAWRGGIRGKIGILCAVFAAFMFIRVFMGDVNVQRFVINIWRLNNEQAALTDAQHELESIKRHIELIQGYSADYVDELGLKYLNIGNANLKILKI